MPCRQIEPLVQPTALYIAVTVLYTGIFLHRPVGVTLRKVTVTERTAAEDTAIGQEVGRTHTQQITRTQVLVIEDPEVFDSHIVVRLGIVERLSIKRVVGPRSDRITALQDTIVNLHVGDSLLSLIGIRRAPRDQGNRLTATGVEIAAIYADVVDRVIGLAIIPPPNTSTRITVTAGQHDTIVVRLEEYPVDHQIMRSHADSDAVAADTLHLMHLDIPDKDIFAEIERRMIIVRTDHLEIGQLNIAHLPKADRNDVYPIRTGPCIVVQVGVDTIPVGRTDFTRSGNLDIFDLFSLNQRQIDIEAMRPGHTGDHHIMTIRRMVRIISFILRLPKNRSRLEMQIDVVAHHEVRRHITPPVPAAVARQNNPASSTFSHIVDGRLYATGIIGKPIAFRPVIQHTHRQIRQRKGIGILGKIPPIFDIEIGGYFRIILIGIFNHGQKTAAHMGHPVALPQRKGIEHEMGLSRSLIKFVQFAQIVERLIHRDHINSDLLILFRIFRQQVAFDPQTVIRCRTRENLSGKRLDHRLLFERDPVDRQLSTTVQRNKTESHQTALCRLNVRKIEVIGLFRTVRFHVERFGFRFIVVPVLFRDKFKAYLVGRAPVLHYEEQRIPLLQRGIEHPVPAVLERW